MNAIAAGTVRVGFTAVAKSPAGFELRRLNLGTPLADDDAVVHLLKFLSNVAK